MKKIIKFSVLLFLNVIILINNVKAGENVNELDKAVNSYINGDAISGYKKDDRFELNPKSWTVYK